MPTAVLLSGGLDSAVLLAEEAAVQENVQPMYVKVGLAWEDAELTMVERFLGSTRFAATSTNARAISPVPPSISVAPLSTRRAFRSGTI